MVILLLSKSEFETNGKVNTDPSPLFYSNVRKQPTFRDLACVQTPSPQQKLEKGRQPLLRFLLRGRGGVCTQTIRDLSVGFET